MTQSSRFGDSFLNELASENNKFDDV
jgi:hypothetical protein